MQRAGSGIGRGVDADRDLTVGPFAQGPAILRGHSDRHPAVLRHRHVVDLPGRRLDQRQHALSEPPWHGHRIPFRLVHELLQVLLVAVRQPRSHGLDGLAAAVPASAPADSSHPWPAGPCTVPRRTHPPRITPTSPEHGSLHVHPHNQHAPEQTRRKDLTKSYSPRWSKREGRHPPHGVPPSFFVIRNRRPSVRVGRGQAAVPGFGGCRTAYRWPNVRATGGRCPPTARPRGRPPGGPPGSGRASRRRSRDRPRGRSGRTRGRRRVRRRRRA